MTNDTDRREVTRRLRELRMKAPGVTSVGHGYLWSLLWAVSGEELGESDRSDWFERMCSRLADLIEPSEPEVKYVAEVKVDGWRIEELAHDAAGELTGIDRVALLALADDLEAQQANKGLRQMGPYMQPGDAANRIREALGVSDA